ncbi:hypothetical protein [Flavobacterium saccharophilum]|uniref:Uncharacterized protein n=1 Tax=Flavobacterium saccharophilum TaxID=29534 RepID=A0A1M7CUK7_9FLAO|nr:hypothetical protein [Flavobacterium saccharophilum]SHL70519.1 hypothetical protein SAMN05444366_1274 [Flavobacterium saccharophilum]
MGFFKNIGKAIKKNVSFKNLVKVATPIMGAIPFVGGTVQNISEGLQASHEAKKQAQAQNNAQAAYDAEQLRLQTLQYAGQQVGAIANAGSQMFAKGITEGAYAGTSSGIKDGLGTVGAEVADSTIKAWFLKHWKHILIGLSIVGAIYLIKKHNDDKNPRRRALQRRR